MRSTGLQSSVDFKVNQTFTIDTAIQPRKFLIAFTPGKNVYAVVFEISKINNVVNVSDTVTTYSSYGGVMQYPTKQDNWVVSDTFFKYRILDYQVQVHNIGSSKFVAGSYEMFNIHSNPTGSKYRVLHDTKDDRVIMMYNTEYLRRVATSDYTQFQAYKTGHVQNLDSFSLDKTSETHELTDVFTDYQLGTTAVGPTVQGVSYFNLAPYNHSNQQLINVSFDRSYVDKFIILDLPINQKITFDISIIYETVSDSPLHMQYAEANEIIRPGLPSPSDRQPTNSFNNNAVQTAGGSHTNIANSQTGVTPSTGSIGSRRPPGQRYRRPTPNTLFPGSRNLGFNDGATPANVHTIGTDQSGRGHFNDPQAGTDTGNQLAGKNKIGALFDIVLQTESDEIPGFNEIDTDPDAAWAHALEQDIYKNDPEINNRAQLQDYLDNHQMNWFEYAYGYLYYAGDAVNAKSGDKAPTVDELLEEFVKSDEYKKREKLTEYHDMLENKASANVNSPNKRQRTEPRMRQKHNVFLSQFLGTGDDSETDSSEDSFVQMLNSIVTNK